MLSDQDTSLKNKFSLEDSLKMLKGHVKSYVSESIKSTNSQPTDIHDFLGRGGCKREEQDLM
jgi:hypothetical protein